MKSKSGVPYETIVQPYANGSNLQGGRNGADDRLADV
mgnify:FL=1